MKTNDFKKKYPRLYNHILKTYAPVFDIYVAIDYYLNGVKPPVCEICSGRVQVSKAHPTRCKKCINVGERYSHDELIAKYPNISIVPFSGKVKPQEYITIVCESHGDQTLTLRTFIRNGNCKACLKKIELQHVFNENVIKFNNIHNNEYTYVFAPELPYDKIKAVCKLHGEFIQSINNHVSGNGCNRCKSEKYQSTINKNETSVSVVEPQQTKLRTTTISDAKKNELLFFTDVSSNRSPETVSEIKSFLESNGIAVVSPHYIDGVEYDIYVPSHNFCVEYEGLYLHSSGSIADDKKWEKAHLNKTELCESHGIKLYHIWENEWVLKNVLWKSMLLSACNKNIRIPARKCKVVDLESRDVSKFCEENHMQGYCGAKHTVGLYYNDELVSMMSFSAPRYNRNIDYELIRFCSKRNTTVIGAFSKMFKHFMSKLPENTSVISYANRRWSNGNTYHINGGTLSNITSPCYFYWANNGRYKLEHRSVYQKHKLADKLEVYNEKRTEVENMYINKFRRIWDCGTKVYIWNKK